MTNIFDQLAQRNTKIPEQPVGQNETPSSPTQSSRDIFQQLSPPKKSLFGQFAEEFTSPEPSAFEQGLGQAARSIGPAIAGAPRSFQDIFDTASSFMWNQVSNITGLPKAMKREIHILPTEEELREKYDKFTSNEFQPKDENQERLQEFGSDVARLMIPTKTNIPFLRAIGSALIGQAGKETAKRMKASPETQNLAKDASMFISSLINPFGALKFRDSLYDAFRKAIPGKTDINTHNLANKLTDFEKKLERGLGATVADKSAVLRPTKALKDKAQTGFMTLEDLIESKIDVNRIMGEPEILKGAKKYLKQLKGIVNEGVEEIGKTHPDALKLYRQADQVESTLQQSQKFSKTVGKIVKAYPWQSGGAATALTYLIGLPFVAKTAPIGIAAVKSAEFFHRFLTNSKLRKYYFNVLKEGLKGNSKSVRENLKKIDDEFSREES